MKAAAMALDIRDYGFVEPQENGSWAERAMAEARETARRYLAAQQELAAMDGQDAMGDAKYIFQHAKERAAQSMLYGDFFDTLDVL